MIIRDQKSTFLKYFQLCGTLSIIESRYDLCYFKWNNLNFFGIFSLYIENKHAFINKFDSLFLTVYKFFLLKNLIFLPCLTYQTNF